jgi:hypothetical protein
MKWNPVIPKSIISKLNIFYWMQIVLIVSPRKEISNKIEQKLFIRKSSKTTTKPNFYSSPKRKLWLAIKIWIAVPTKKLLLFYRS